MWVSIINKSLNYRLANINRIQQKHSLPKTTNLENSLIVLPEYCSVKPHLKQHENVITINVVEIDTNAVKECKDCICKEMMYHSIVANPKTSIKTVGEGFIEGISEGLEKGLEKSSLKPKSYSEGFRGGFLRGLKMGLIQIFLCVLLVILIEKK